MLLIYNFTLLFFLILGFPVFIFICNKEKYKSSIFRKLYLFSLKGYKEKQYIMIHGVSVGEINAAIPLIYSVKKRFFNYDVLVTCSTFTGYKNALNKCEDIDVVYFPLDFYFSVKNFFKSFNIKKIIVLETEFWPNFINEAYKKNIPFYIVNARISDKSFPKYLFFNFFLKNYLRKITYFFCQSKIDEERLISLGAEKTIVENTGSMKFDSALFTYSLFKEEKLLKKINFKKNSPVFLAGSTQETENIECLKCYLELKKNITDLKFILVPRKPESLSQTIKMLNAKDIAFTLRSNISNESFIDDIFIIDTIGELFDLYHFADIVFIGKSLVKNGGGQNPLEPAIHGKAVLIGESYENFRNIVDNMIQKNAILLVENFNDLQNKLNSLLQNKSLRCTLGANAKNFVIENAITCDRIISKLI